MYNNLKEKVIVITGPTGVGKTDISLDICKKYNGEIINCDASQMKKDLDIGTAKIDLTSTDVVHHFINVINANENYSIKDFQTNGRDIITDIINRGKLPFIVGGTGLYINALLFNYNLTSDERNPEFELKYQEKTNHELHNLLKSYDETIASTIHENNRRRVLRALEKVMNDNKCSNEKNQELLYDAKIICLNTDRKVLYERINLRVDKMLDEGWIEECLDLKKKGYDLSLIKDIGYREINDYLNENLNKEEMVEMIKQKTRNYAKRQITWFKNKIDCEWVNIDYSNPDNVLSAIRTIIDRFLNE